MRASEISFTIAPMLAWAIVRERPRMIRCLKF